MGSSALSSWLVGACTPAGCEKYSAKKLLGCSLHSWNPGCRPALDDSRRGGSVGRRRMGFLTAAVNPIISSGFCPARDSNSKNHGRVLASATHHANDVVNKEKPSINERRVVVTGFGVVSPVGHEPDEFYGNLLEGVSSISEIEAFDPSEYSTRIAREIKSFSTDGLVAPKHANRLDRFMLFLLVEGKKALFDGGVTDDVMDEFDKTRCGILIGSAMGGMRIFSDAIEALQVSYKKMNPFCVPFSVTSMGSAILSIDLIQGWMGPNNSISTACAMGNFCILNAANHIIKGAADVMLCGGSDSVIIPSGVGGFIACKALSQRNDDPTRASRPWDSDRDGFVLGEGAGVLLLEELEHAKGSYLQQFHI